MALNASAQTNIRLMVVFDLVFVTLAYMIVYILKFYSAPLPDKKALEYAIWGAVFIATWIAAIAAKGGYNKKNLFVGSEEYRRVFDAATLSVLLISLMIFFAKEDISRAWILGSWLLGMVLVLRVRYAYRMRLHAQNRRREQKNRVLIVGANREAADIAAAVDRAGHLASKVVGALDGQGGSDPRLTVVGDIADLRDYVQREKTDAVVIVPSALGSQALSTYASLKDLKCSVFIAPSLRDVVASRVSIQPVGDIPLIRLEPVRIEGFPWLVKRIFDIVAGGFLFMLLIPVFVLMAAAIKLTSRGPWLFTQRRVGRDGAEFMIYKARTMVQGAEQKLSELEYQNEADGHIFKMKNDPRITRVGKFLRRWSLDELPQLINVLKGEMSLVGPRPPIVEEVAKYNKWEKNRLGTVPGMTGYWQVSGRSEVSFTEMVKMDIYYIENWSLSFDLYILFRTYKAVVSRHGAY